MKRFLLLALLFFAGICAGMSPVQAAKQGRANLFLRSSVTKLTTASLQVGDVLNMELFIEGREEQITGIDLFLSFDDTFMQLIPAGFHPVTGAPRPFTDGGYLGTAAQVNDTQGDNIGNSDANNQPGFQMHYNADIPSTFGGGQRFVSGDGVIARFALRIIRKPVNGATAVNVVRASATGGETGYYKVGDAGNIYSFNNITSLSLNIQGFNTSLNIPDLYMLPAQIDSTLDLDDHIEEPANPDTTLTWTSSIPLPDSVLVAINPTSHRVLVDPRIITGTDTTSFIGIAQVLFTATTRFDESIADTVRIIVDTPPRFIKGVGPETVRYFEDRDTTFVLKATDPDRGARLVFTKIDTSSLVFAFLDAQSVAGDTTKQVVRMSARQNFFGQLQQRFRVTDQFGLSDTLAVIFDVKPVNDPPEFIKDLGTVDVDALGQTSLSLADYVRDIDDPFSRLQFSFTGVDSIAFDVINGNIGRLLITAVPPFQGTRTANVVVTDTSNAVAIKSITVRVLPPKDPQPPKLNRTWMKIGVRAGAEATVVALDTLVSDLDTAKDKLIWTHSPVTRVQVDAPSLQNRQLRVSAPADSTGFRPMTLKVTDPIPFSDSLSVRIYASSVLNGIPVAGGMPDLSVVVGKTDSLNLNDYYFDADHTDQQVTWTVSGHRDVTVTIDPATHKATLSPKQGATNSFEDIVFTVRDPNEKTATDTVRVIILDPGSVVIDLDVIGRRVDLKLGQADTVALTPLIWVGNINTIVWKATSRNPSVVFSQLESLGHNLFLIGVQPGSTQVVLTATDTLNGKNFTDSLQVVVGFGSTPDSLAVQDIGPLVLTAGRDTTLNLKALVLAGNLNSLAWSSTGNANIGVEIDTLKQVAILHPKQDFLGNAGALVFQVRDASTGKTTTSIASPIQVVRGAQPPVIGGDLLKISVIVNPVLKNYLDVFVRSRRVLLSKPFLEVLFGENPELPRSPIAVDPVGLVADMWVGDLRLGNDVTGIVELTATGIAKETSVALIDTLRMRIEQATVRSTFAIAHAGVLVTLPAGGVNAASLVALIPERRDAALSKPVAGELIPISDTYSVVAPNAQVNQPGEIAFDLGGYPEHAGVYRWDESLLQWVWVGSDFRNGFLVGTFDAFGRYGVFVDNNRQSELFLHQNFPNPFNPQTTIRFDLPESGDVHLTIYNAIGQMVSTLKTGYLPAGQHRVVWDARDLFGQTVGTGLYVYRLETGGRVLTRKMLFVK